MNRLNTPMRIAVLVSGGGTNLQALIDADRSSDTSHNSSFEIALVIADRPCYALQRAQNAGIKNILVSAPKGEKKSEARLSISNQILHLVQEKACDAIVLAGFLTILKGPIINDYSNRIVNLHPALLPKFGGEGMWGHHVHEAVLTSGEAESGCTIHLVDAGCDTGPILLQKKVPVLPGDTIESLASRISEQEHSAIVEGVQELARQLKSALLATG